MTDAPKPLREIAEQFGSLSKELKECTDPGRRRELLRQFRTLLGEADRIIADQAASD